MPIGLFKRPPFGGDDTLNGPRLISIDGVDFPVTYRRNARARRIILRMDRAGTGIVLTVPSGTSAHEAYDFAVSQSGWIWQRRPICTDLPGPQSLDGKVLPFRGVDHAIVVESGRGSPVHVRDLPNRALVVRGKDSHLERRLTDFLKRQARADLERACTRYCELMGVTFTRLSVRDTRSRWGSCSSSGALSFSWRLVLAPPDILDYVAAHEVAHLVEMNHSERFWALVRQHCRHTDTARKWLRRHGQKLHQAPV